MKKLAPLKLAVKTAQFNHDTRIRDLSGDPPDPKFKEWPHHYLGAPIEPFVWPEGTHPIIYFYFWLNRNPANPPVPVETEEHIRKAFEPADLFYMGQRRTLSLFSHGWKPKGNRSGDYNKHEDLRYHWLPSAHGRQIYAVIYELPVRRKYKELNEKRMSVEYLVATNIRERYANDRRVLEQTRRLDRHPGWVRSTDVKHDAQWILDDLKACFGI